NPSPWHASPACCSSGAASCSSAPDRAREYYDDIAVNRCCARAGVISFIVPAYNEEALLGPTLEALTDAGSALGEPFEIVVADDASTDRTVEIARAHGTRVITVHNRQIAATRNAGARAARGELLLFVDADTVVSRAVVRGAVEAMRAGAAGGGSGL